MIMLSQSSLVQSACFANWDSCCQTRGRSLKQLDCLPSRGRYQATENHTSSGAMMISRDVVITIQCYYWSTGLGVLGGQVPDKVEELSP